MPEWGWFYWMPLPQHAPSTNTIAVIATDNGQPALSSTNRFVVVVPDFCLLRAGTHVLETGQTGSVALAMQTSTRVTALAFRLRATPGA